MKLAVLAEKLGASLAPAPGKNLAAVESLEITGVAGLEKAGPQEVSFLTNLKYSHQAKATKAATDTSSGRRLLASRQDTSETMGRGSTSTMIIRPPELQFAPRS